MKPSVHLYDEGHVYVPSHKTDIRETFARFGFIPPSPPAKPLPSTPKGAAS